MSCPKSRRSWGPSSSATGDDPYPFAVADRIRDDIGLLETPRFILIVFVGTNESGGYLHGIGAVPFS
jgi:hypothetical protein